jgi:hypothetical protein
MKFQETLKIFWIEKASSVLPVPSQQLVLDTGIHRAR